MDSVPGPRTRRIARRGHRGSDPWDSDTEYGQTFLIGKEPFMVKKKRSFYIKFIVLIVGLGLLLVGPSSLGAAGAEDARMTVLNPFSLQVIQVQPRPSTSIVVLRSTSLRTANTTNQLSPSLGNRLTMQSGGLVFRNSVVRVPLMPEVRSPSAPN